MTPWSNRHGNVGPDQQCGGHWRSEKCQEQKSLGLCSSRQHLTMVENSFVTIK